MTSPCSSQISIETRFKVLDQFIAQTQDLWRVEPFAMSLQQEVDLQEADLPEIGLQTAELWAWLSQLDLVDIEYYQNNEDLLAQQLSAFIPSLIEAMEMCQLPFQLVSQQSSNLVEPKHLSVGISGRKWQQICAMSELAINLDNQSHELCNEWVEWCAGKGYLGQVLNAQSGKRVLSLERDTALCHSGQKLADKHSLAMQFMEQDVLADEALKVLQPNRHVVALHACGDLHQHLISHSPQQKVSALTVSPCCYHLTKDDVYQPLSKLAQQSHLSLLKKDLRMVVQETVTGGQRVKRHRQLEMTYRLALDSLLRAKFGHKQYTNIPSIKKSILSLGFEHFCLWANKQRHFVDPEQLNAQEINFSAWLKVGEKRFLKVERLNLLQFLFKRPLEIWLACDKSLFLEENFYQVSLSLLKIKAITPRNIVIQAQMTSNG